MEPYDVQAYDVQPYVLESYDGLRPVPPRPRPGGDHPKTTPGRRVLPTCPEARGIHSRTDVREPQP